MVSPSMRSMMKPVPSSSSGFSTCSTRGDGRPASMRQLHQDGLGIEPDGAPGDAP